MTLQLLFDSIMLGTRHYDHSIAGKGLAGNIVLIYVEWGKVGNLDYIKMIHGDAGRASMGVRQENWYQIGYSQIDMNDGLRMRDCLLFLCG